jgi:hypothetical protein
MVLSMEACNLDIPISTHLHLILAVILLLGSLVHMLIVLTKHVVISCKSAASGLWYKYSVFPSSLLEQQSVSVPSNHPVISLLPRLCFLSCQVAI